MHLLALALECYPPEALLHKGSRPYSSEMAYCPRVSEQAFLSVIFRELKLPKVKPPGIPPSPDLSSPYDSVPFLIPPQFPGSSSIAGSEERYAYTSFIKS